MDHRLAGGMLVDPTVVRVMDLVWKCKRNVDNTIYAA